MSHSTFEDFCASVCTLAGVPPPDFDEQIEGPRGFTLTHGNAEVTFFEAALGDLAAVLVFTRFGAPPPDKEAKVLSALMDANFELADLGTAAFTRDPADGVISLRHLVLLSQITAQEAYAGLLRASDSVEEWLRTYFLEAPPESGLGKLLMQGLA